MAGRVKRKAGLADAAARAADAAATAAAQARCWLCGRPLGTATEWHHPIPKSRGGRATVAVHPLCHRTIHAELPNAALAAMGGADGDWAAARAALGAEPGIARFLAWVADKPADFRTPVRRRRAR